VQQHTSKNVTQSATKSAIQNMRMCATMCRNRSATQLMRTFAPQCRSVLALLFPTLSVALFRNSIVSPPKKSNARL